MKICKRQKTIAYLLQKDEILLTREKATELLNLVRRNYEDEYKIIKMLILKEENSSKKVISD